MSAFENEHDEERERIAKAMPLVSRLLKRGNLGSAAVVLASRTGMHQRQAELVIAALTLEAPPGQKRRADAGACPWPEREYLVIWAVACGLTSRQIAKLYSVSIETVKTYRSLAMTRVNARTSAKAVLIAYRNGWFQVGTELRPLDRWPVSKRNGPPD